MWKSLLEAVVRMRAGWLEGWRSGISRRSEAEKERVVEDVVGQREWKVGDEGIKQSLVGTGMSFDV